MGELVTNDGGVPVWHRSFDGNQADVGTVVAQMEALRAHVPLPECLVIGDSKLLSSTVIERLRRQQLHFLAPLPKSAELDARVSRFGSGRLAAAGVCGQTPGTPGSGGADAVSRPGSRLGMGQPRDGRKPDVPAPVCDQQRRAGHLSQGARPSKWPKPRRNWPRSRRGWANGS